MEEVIPSHLNLFSAPQALMSIDEYKYEKIMCKTRPSDTLGQLEFTANADKVNYTDLHESLLMIKCSYNNVDGSVIATDPIPIGPVQNPLTSIFKSMELSINDEKVTPNDDNAAYINFLHTFTQSKAAKESYLTTSLYYEDTFESTDTCNQNNPNAPANINKGLKKRASFFNGSKIVVLIGKIHIAPHNTNRLYLPHLKFDWKFVLNPMEFYSMTADDETKYKFSIHEAAILLRRVSVSPSISLAHDELLQTENAIYPCRHIITKTYNIPSQYYDFTYENAFVGNIMPTAIFVGFVKSTAKAGNLAENPFCFHHLFLDELWVRLGTKKIPAVDYTLDQGQDQTQFSLWETYNALDCFGSNNGPGNLNRSSFANGAFLVGFDLSRDGNPHGMYINQNLAGSSISIQGKFSKQLSEPYTGRDIYK